MADLSVILPRVLIVSRRSLRKNKFVDFVGEDIDPSHYEAEASGLLPEEGAQVLNVACGGTLYQDIGKELGRNCPEYRRVVHIDYEIYDGHRHVVRVVENTPLSEWFRDSLDGGKVEIRGFYDPDAYNPEEGKFIMGLQFHPERMRKPDSDEFDYPGCPAAYKCFGIGPCPPAEKRVIVNNFCGLPPE
uniref:Glutamine amidotransferase domain-containing protein n=1 Tax=Daucus carota subsp. sativus TaxID=79200 RepID=A0A164Y3S6_DAUCS